MTTIIPSTNNSSAMHNYDSRLDYKKMALDFLDAAKQKSRFIDLWYDKPLYGKIDLEGNAVHNLPESTLKQLNSNGETMFAIDFVAHAFEDMKKYFIDAVAKGEMGSKIGSIDGLNPKRAWTSPLSAFEDHMQLMKNFFMSEYLMANEKHVHNIQDTIVQYKRFVKAYAKDFPMTFSRFLLSDFCPIQSTGLIIELSEFKHGDDIVNLEIMDSYVFNKYTSIANRYGFFVNKNAPYALVANLGSSIMKRYMRHYDVYSPKHYFEEYCYPAYRSDMHRMRDFVYQCYSEFVAARPFQKSTAVTKKGLRNKTRTRQYLTLGQYNSTISMNEWTEICIFVKASELGIDMHPTEVKRLVEKVNYLRSRENEVQDERATASGWAAGSLSQEEREERTQRRNAERKLWANRSMKEINDYFKKRDPRVNLLLKGKVPTGSDHSMGDPNNLSY